MTATTLPTLTWEPSAVTVGANTSWSNFLDAIAVLVNASTDWTVLTGSGAASYLEIGPNSVDPDVADCRILVCIGSTLTDDTRMRQGTRGDMCIGIDPTGGSGAYTSYDSTDPYGTGTFSLYTRTRALTHWDSVWLISCEEIWGIHGDDSADTQDGQQSFIFGALLDPKEQESGVDSNGRMWGYAASGQNDHINKNFWNLYYSNSMFHSNTSNNQFYMGAFDKDWTWRRLARMQSVDTQENGANTPLKDAWGNYMGLTFDMRMYDSPYKYMGRGRQINIWDRGGIRTTYETAGGTVRAVGRGASKDSHQDTIGFTNLIGVPTPPDLPPTMNWRRSTDLKQYGIDFWTGEDQHIDALIDLVDNYSNYWITDQGSGALGYCIFRPRTAGEGNPSGSPLCPNMRVVVALSTQITNSAWCWGSTCSDALHWGLDPQGGAGAFTTHQSADPFGTGRFSRYVAVPKRFDVREMWLIESEEVLSAHFSDTGDNDGQTSIILGAIFEPMHDDAGEDGASVCTDSKERLFGIAKSNYGGSSNFISDRFWLFDNNFMTTNYYRTTQDATVIGFRPNSAPYAMKKIEVMTISQLSYPNQEFVTHGLGQYVGIPIHYRYHESESPGREFYGRLRQMRAWVQDYHRREIKDTGGNVKVILRGAYRVEKKHTLAFVNP